MSASGWLIVTFAEGGWEGDGSNPKRLAAERGPPLQ